MAGDWTLDRVVLHRGQRVRIGGAVVTGRPPKSSTRNHEAESATTRKVRQSA